MRISLALLALALTAGCTPDGGKKGAKNVSDDTGEPQIKPPKACPVGPLRVTQGMVDADLALLDSWNELRLAGGSCDGTPVDSANALTADEALMWTARCWAHDISLNGPPTVSNEFSDGTTLEEASSDQGFAGILNGWGAQGALQSSDEALTNWVDGGGEACQRIWGEGSFGAMATSDAGGLLVVVRLSAFGPG